eukprot:6190940-Pleurochrysis_carterae.AAC.1
MNAYALGQTGVKQLSCNFTHAFCADSSLSNRCSVQPASRLSNCAFVSLWTFLAAFTSRRRGRASRRGQLQGRRTNRTQVLEPVLASATVRTTVKHPVAHLEAVVAVQTSS